MYKENLTLKDLVSSEELSELNIDELLEVQGGVDSDEDDNCTGSAPMCNTGAVKNCYGGGA